jgi:signal recognition particle GTPase
LTPEVSLFGRIIIAIIIGLTAFFLLEKSEEEDRKNNFIAMGFFDKIFGKKEKESLDQGLQKTKENFFSKITKAIAGKGSVDEEVLDNLEEALVSADVGIDTTVKISERRVA